MSVSPVVSEVSSLSDDEIRSKLKEFGYNPPPIQDDITRKILRKKLIRFIDPSITFEEKVWNDEDSNDDETKVTSTRLRRRNESPRSPVPVENHPGRQSGLTRLIAILSVVTLIPLLLYVWYFV
ncbi:hypothetical protein EG68_08728 [Paragonimus skrjabini miyazakii]|uniref:LEM domain-containing protein n=1 Tax=Paragonimus skrjabini miyazakii TaxID=59628 RepID=A0A8S9YTN9_9TREM|nr:hypothetical protein EG68_08728 [Paragonimus skrjabini miyazakii]